MTQRSNVIADSDGPTFLTALNAALAAIVSGHGGTVDPAYKVAGMQWYRTDVPGTGVWTKYEWDGTHAIVIGVLDTTAGTWTPSGISQVVDLPKGRLTLTTATPVLSGNVAGSATVYYTPYNGNQLPIYNGTTFAMAAFAELSNALGQSSTGKAGPAAATTNSNYDLFVWDDSGTKRLTRGPAWTGDTTRGTGAGTTELQRVLGIWTNKVAITNGPGAGLGTYVGTIRTNGSSTVDWNTGGIASNGQAAFLGVWNCYNRISVAGIVGDSTSSWNYSSTTWRGANASTTMRASFVVGIQEDQFSAKYAAIFGDSSSFASCLAGIGYDSTSAPSGVTSRAMTNGGYDGGPFGFFTAQPLGFHYMQALEVVAVNSGTITWYGTMTSPAAQTGLQYEGKF